MSTIDLSAYPLTWPVGRPRTRARKRARFHVGNNQKITIYVALSRLREQLRLVRAEDVVVSSNVPTRNDGLPYSRVTPPEDPGVAVYFRLSGSAHCLACDAWETVAENIAAIAAHVGAIRGQGRWGVGDIAQAFAGYRALPAMGAVHPWWEVLGFEEPPETVDEVEAKWLALLMQHHPDKGGNQAQAAEINAARRDAELYYRSGPQ